MVPLTSLDVGRAALKMAVTDNRADEQDLRLQMFQQQNIQAIAIDFGGEFVPSVKKIIERAVVAAQRQGLVPSNHVGEGAVAGATRAALGQISAQAVGLSVGGKIGVARHGEHLCVAIFLGIGVLNLNEVAVGLAHRSLPE
ncbi:MAG: HutP family protein [Veillonellaceae bacterium]|nr:HutP family protein [Veillonellaceae bacterium]